MGAGPRPRDRLARLAPGGPGSHPYQNWADGRSWRLGPTYLVVERSPALTADRHDRCRPGLNHLAFHVEDAAAVERLAEESTRHGWHLMFPDRHPHAGGPQHHAAYLENDDGFEVELVALPSPDAGPARRLWPRSVVGTVLGTPSAVAGRPNTSGTVLPWSVTVLAPAVAPGKDMPLYTK